MSHDNIDMTQVEQCDCSPLSSTLDEAEGKGMDCKSLEEPVAVGEQPVDSNEPQETACSDHAQCPGPSQGRVEDQEMSSLKFQSGEEKPEAFKRYLSSSERCMHIGMSMSMFTIGELLEFTTKRSLQYEDVLECLYLIHRKYEMLQVKAVFDQKRGKHYWSKFPSNEVFTTHNLGKLTDDEIHNRFNQIVHDGFEVDGHIWKFYFMEVASQERESPQGEPSLCTCRTSSNHDLPISIVCNTCREFTKDEANCPSDSSVPPEGTMSDEKETRSESRLRRSQKKNEDDERVGQCLSDSDETPSPFSHTYCLFFIMSHALVDGIGIANIIADFFTTLCVKINNSTNTTPHRDLWEVLEVSPVAIAPPYEELVPNLMLYRALSLPLSFLFKKTLRACLRFNRIPFCKHPIFKSPNLKPELSGGSQSSGPSLDVARTGTELIKFSAEEFDAFTAFRKRHSLTVTGLALSIFSTALVKFAYDGMSWPNITLAAHILRDPRRYFKKTDVDERSLVANYVASGLIIILPFFKQNKKKVVRAGDSMVKTVIDLAHVITQQIRGNVKNFQTFFNGELQRRVAKDMDLVNSFIDKFSAHPRIHGRFSIIQFSNIGEVSCNDQERCGDFDAVAVNKSIALADQSRFGDCFCNVLMTLQGQLHWTISYPAHLYSKDRVHSLAQEMKSIWRHVVLTPPLLQQEQGSANKVEGEVTNGSSSTGSPIGRLS